MKEVENKQAFYNNGIYFNWKIHLMVPRIKLLKRSWKWSVFPRKWNFAAVSHSDSKWCKAVHIIQIDAIASVNLYK